MIKNIYTIYFNKNNYFITTDAFTTEIFQKKTLFAT